MLQPQTRGATVDHAVTMRSTYERINKGDIAGFGDLVADDFVEHQGAGGPGFPPTKDGTLEFFRTLLAAFPDWRTHVDVQLIDIMRFDGAGLVCEHWGVADMLSLLQQLGVVPAGPPA